MLCVIIADDHPLIRLGVAKLLADELAATVTKVGSLAELRQALAAQTQDLLILDLTISENSLQAIPELRLLYPDLPILVLSTLPERPAGVKAILAGANGYLSKSASPEDLLQAVQQVLGGDRYISPELGQALAEHVIALQTRAEDPHRKLSAREHEVLIKISEGLTTSKIAVQLGLSPKTVGTYRARILDKLEIGTTAGLTRYVIEKGLSENES